MVWLLLSIYISNIFDMFVPLVIRVGARLECADAAFAASCAIGLGSQAVIRSRVIDWSDRNRRQRFSGPKDVIFH